MMVSQILSLSERKEIERIGDILAPGDDLLPRFSACGFAEHADRMLLYLPGDEVARLRLFLRFTRFLPLWALRAVLKATALDRFLPNFAGSRLRKLEMGLRGLVFSLYYSFLDVPSGCGRRIQGAIRWDAAIRTQPEDADDLPDLVQRANPIGEPEPNQGDPPHGAQPPF
jgi:hypothetical protein